jgi:hypothetical protein
MLIDEEEEYFSGRGWPGAKFNTKKQHNSI